LSLKLLLWVLVACRRLGAVRSATTLALAGVLAFATVVTGLAATLALTRVLALTGVLFLYFLIGLLVGALVGACFASDDAPWLAIVTQAAALSREARSSG